MTETTTKRHQVGQCPACKSGLWAEVDIETVVYEPTLDAEGKATAYARARAVAMRLDHACDAQSY